MSEIGLNFRELSNEFYIYLEQLLLTIDNRCGVVGGSRFSNAQNADIDRALGKLHYIYEKELENIND